MTEIKDLSAGPQACSEACRQKRIAETCLKKYGSTNAVNSKYARDKAKKRSVDQYGVEYPMQRCEVKAKVRLTNLKRYGVTSAMKSPEIQAKARRTNLERRGVEYPMQSNEVKAKSAQTFEKKYGGFTFGSTILSEQVRQTNLTRYGVENVMQSTEIQDRSKKTCVERYGSENWFSSDEHIRRWMSDPSRLNQFLEFRSDPKNYISSHYSHKPRAAQIAIDIGVYNETVYVYLDKFDAWSLVAYRESAMEHDVCQYLSELVPGIIIERNTHQVITPWEIDIYLPEYKIGIECNPTFTHNSSEPDIWNSNPMPKDYHYTKTQAADSAGILLVHIFGWQWSHKIDIVKSMLANLLHQNKRRFYARSLQICDVSYDDSNRFLNHNHIQGQTSAKVRLGLYNGSELISMMSFIQPRGTMGKTKISQTGTWELVRFCTVLNTNVVGGASKLFSHFIENYHPGTVISFSNASYTRGGMYSVLGFNQVARLGPGYCWVNKKTDIAYNRVVCQKQKLIKFLGDPEIDLHQTEVQIMESHGFVRVFDSGMVKWVWHPSL
jgi:hypothetical protein